MPTYIREKCLCCECKYYQPPFIPLILAEITTPSVCIGEKCKKNELAIKDMLAKGNCKYFEAYE